MAQYRGWMMFIKKGKSPIFSTFAKTREWCIDAINKMDDWTYLRAGEEWHHRHICKEVNIDILILSEITTNIVH